MRFITLLRIARYVLVKAVWLAAMVAIGVFLAIVVINYGGYIDEMVRAQIDGAIQGYAMAGGFRGMTEEQGAQALKDMRWSMEEAAGLHQPFLIRCALWFGDAVTLDFGNTRGVVTLSGPSLERHNVRAIILQRLPNTLLLSGMTNLLLFLASVFLALPLLRKYGTWLDKAVVAASPLSAAPNWVYGVILIVIFAAQLHWLPFNGMYDDLPPETRLGYVPVVLRHLVLPVAAITFSTFFQSLYAWRTFYLMHVEDDHVEMARARGLPPAVVERRYILRPTLPFLITSFALMLISFWQGAIALETLFGWPGIGSLLLTAIRTNDRAATVGVVVLFAYVLAMTVFLLDIVYVLVDPRIRLGGGGQTLYQTDRRKRRLQLRRPHWRPRPSSVPAGRSIQAGNPAPGRASRFRGRPAFGGWLRKAGGGLRSALRMAARYPSAAFALGLILNLCAMGVYTVIAIPRDEAVALWVGQGRVWDKYPRNALPAWVNLFRRDDLPETIVMSSKDGTAAKQARAVSADMTEIAITFAFDYPYGGFPQDMILNLDTEYRGKRPHLVLTWLPPDGRELELASFSLPSDQTYYLANDDRLKRKVGKDPLRALFLDPASPRQKPLPGRYALRVNGFVFEEDATVDAEMVLYGQVHGLAGTDHRRRDLSLPLLWGTPIALAFGLGGAVATSLITMILAAMGVWFGGALDNLIQRVTEVNMILPALPIAIMVYFLYSKSVWAILGVMVLLSIFGSALKNYRAVFMQVKESPYIEAARAYNTTSWRMIRLYMVPRILPVLLPQIVILVPGFVFLEATLAYLGVSDLFLPTWGKVIYDALKNGAYRGYFYWVLEPIALLMLTGLAFALLGIALERVYNPRLREQ